MKKLLLFILFAAAAYFAYEYLIKEKELVEIKDDIVVTTSFPSDIEAPALSPLHYGSVQGTVKNISDKTLNNIILKYKIDGNTVEAIIYSLSPGQEQNFSTPAIMIRSSGSPFYLDSLIIGS